MLLYVVWKVPVVQNSKDHYKRKGPLLKENKQKHNKEAKCNCKGERREVVEPEPHFSLLANNFPEKTLLLSFFSVFIIQRQLCFCSRPPSQHEQQEKHSRHQFIAPESIRNCSSHRSTEVLPTACPNAAADHSGFVRRGVSKHNKNDRYNCRSCPPFSLLLVRRGIVHRVSKHHD